MTKKFLFFIFILTSSVIVEAAPSQAKLKTLYASLDPKSVAQHLAFFELYPETLEGKKAIHEAWRLLSEDKNSVKYNAINEVPLNAMVQGIVMLVNKQPNADLPVLDQSELDTIEKLAQSLSNRRLKGHLAAREEDVLKLPQEEIDLARALFLTQMGPDEIKRIAIYEALVDLMALQIRARLQPNATPQMKIRAINDFIFNEMGFRFPPHSLYAKDIDEYTFLPSVLDSRRGVCLGVSILYICLAQRLNLPLEMVTPPGHIYVRYRQGDVEINIETTARGIHIDSEEYLSIETRALQQRNIKEVIGLAHFNQASVFWQREEYENAVKAYEKAKLYLPEDMLLKELLGYAYLLTDRDVEGKALLLSIRGHVPDHAISHETLAEDYLEGNVDKEGIKAIFMHVDENRETIIKKRETLEAIIEKFPRFRSGIFSLAVTWLQLHRQKEALDVLERFHQIESKDPSAEYYLTMLYAMRFDFVSAWNHYKIVEEVLKEYNHAPKILRELHRELTAEFPE